MERRQLKKDQLVYIVDKNNRLNAITGRVVEKLVNNNPKEEYTDLYKVIDEDGNERLLYFPSTSERYLVCEREDYLEVLTELKNKDISEINEIREHLSTVFSKIDELRNKCKEVGHNLTPWEYTSWIVKDRLAPNGRRLENGWVRSCKCCLYQEKSVLEPEDLLENERNKGL